MLLRLINGRYVIGIVCLIPLLWLIYDTVFDALGADPIQALHQRLGDWSLRFLWLTLAVTPVQSVMKWPGMTPYRQLLGLYACFYASLHVITYLAIDHGFMWRLIGIDIIESPYIWLGLYAYSIVFLLAITSSKWAKKRLGKQWKKLHKLIYSAAIAVIIHYYWQLKGNLAEPMFYLIVIILLLSFRLAVRLKKHKIKFNKLKLTRKMPVIAEKNN